MTSLLTCRRLFCSLAAVALLAAGSTSPGRAALPENYFVLQWNRIAEDIVTIPPAGSTLKTYQNEGLIYMAYLSAAIYDAATVIEGRYEPYDLQGDACAARGHSRGHRQSASPIDVLPGASADAAVVEAAYRTLLHYFPSDAATLNARYAESLAAIEDSPSSRQDGIAVGAAVATQLICLRAGDHLPPLTQTSSFELREAGPGVWRLTPPYAAPQTPWVGSVEPFILNNINQFHPALPPPLRSTPWVAQYNEVKDYGSLANASGLRTPEQTATATFWTANVIRQYNRLGRELATQRGLDRVETARLLAMINIIGADAQIAVMHWKYHFLFWRPVTAIDPCSVTNDGFGSASCDPSNLDSDLNPATVEEVGWRPLIPTPNHPEYPGAHGSITGAIMEVLTEVFGTQLEMDIHGSPGDTVRHFGSAEEIVDQVIDARVWAGLHYRGSSEAGVRLGQKVAHFDLHHAFQPMH